MRKTKVTSVLAGVSMLACVLAGCDGGFGQKPKGPVTKEFTQDDIELDASKIQGGWAYVTYPLDDFAGKKVTIDFSCEMKVENSSASDQKLQWQINNNGSYPTIVDHTFGAGTTDFVKVEGKNAEEIEIASGALLYLSTYQLDTDNLKISVKNIKYSVTYTGVAEQPAVTYPTDIFTVGDAGSCGITLGDKFEKLTVFSEGSAGQITENSDGSVTFVATAAGGGGGGAAFYMKSDKTEINLANYESIDLELVYSPVTGKWASNAKNPGFALRILPWDSTGMFGGYEDLEYFGGDGAYGELKKNIKITDAFVERIKASSDFDSILGFALKFNDYNSGNKDGDQLRVQVKQVKFNKKAGAGEDKAFDDGLTAAQHGTVKEINYPTRDYTVAEDKVTDADKYNKHAWVYLPAGYDDPANADKKYPLFILLHGYGQNENTWGLSNKGRGGKIKGYMDRGMASGDVKEFILVCATGVADKSWGPNGGGNSVNGFNAFGGELRNDLIPYMRSNYRVADGRDNVAMAGLSMGGGQTFNIGIGECLDLISYFGGFSGALFDSADDFMKKVDGNAAFNGLKIHHLYMICGDADSLVYGSFPGYVDAMKGWSRVEKFDSDVVPGGTHDFPVWYKGFKTIIPMVFK